MQLKVCSKCSTEKSVAEFFRTGKTKTGKNKFRGDCKECSKRDTSAWRAKNRQQYNSYMVEYRGLNPDKIRLIEIKRDYGLSSEQYLKMINDQNNLCKICGKPPKGIRPLAIDHCHTTKKVRGLLCYRCNQAISILDDKDHLEKALVYLKG
jgi:hypothetical protein